MQNWTWMATLPRLEVEELEDNCGICLDDIKKPTDEEGTLIGRTVVAHKRERGDGHQCYFHYICFESYYNINFFLLPFYTKCPICKIHVIPSSIFKIRAAQNASFGCVAGMINIIVMDILGSILAPKYGYHYFPITPYSEEYIKTDPTLSLHYQMNFMRQEEREFKESSVAIRTLLFSFAISGSMTYLFRNRSKIPIVFAMAHIITYIVLDYGIAIGLAFNRDSNSPITLIATATLVNLVGGIVGGLF